jgi:hypothetical protein
MVDGVRRRQLNGELTENLDPAYLLLVLFAAALAPSVIRRSCGGLPASRRTRAVLVGVRRSATRIVEHLAGTSAAE